MLIDVGGAAEQTCTPQMLARLVAAREHLAKAGCGAGGRGPDALWLDSSTDGQLRVPASSTPGDHHRSTRPNFDPSILGNPDLSRADVPRLSIDFYLGQAADEGGRLGQGFSRGGSGETLPAGPLTSLLADGIDRRASAACSCFLPQILILFGFIAILEDCGYMARAAFLMDKLMARCGLSGKSFIPLLSSVACAVPGIMATRVIENRRDRLGDDPRRAAHELLGAAAGLRALDWRVSDGGPAVVDAGRGACSAYMPSG